MPRHLTDLDLPLSLTTDVDGDLPLSNLAGASAASKLLGRGSAAGAGDFQEISLGTGLTMSGTTLSADAVGGMIMGELSVTGNTTGTVISTADTWTRVAPVAGSLNVGENFDSPANCRIRYIGADTIMLHCGVTFSVKSAGPNDRVGAIIYYNGTVNGSNEYTGGTALTQGYTEQKLGAAGDIASTAIHVIVMMETNDYLELAVKNITDGDDLTVTDLNLFAVGMPPALAQVSNGDKGDITVSGAGSTWTIDNSAVTEAKMSLADNTTGDVSTTKHGFAPKAPNDTTKYLRGDATWAVPAGSSEAWPVGSVFIAVVSTNPNTLLGYGTWSAFGAGRVLVGLDSGQTEFDTVEETGGSKTHTLVTAELPSHSHSITDPGHNHTQNAHTHSQTSYATATGGSTGWTVDTSMSGSTTTATQTTGSTTATNQSSTTGITGTNTAGSGTAHNNLQPYIVVYMWKRTA